MTQRFKIHVANNKAILDMDNTLVATARTAAEAVLLASAPEMLEALKALLFAATDDADANDGVMDRPGIAGIARAAIAKAEGEK
jgi:predicted HAD superfamily phosphohydrolase YqeG